MLRCDHICLSKLVHIVTLFYLHCPPLLHTCIVYSLPWNSYEFPDLKKLQKYQDASWKPIEYSQKSLSVHLRLCEAPSHGLATLFQHTSPALPVCVCVSAEKSFTSRLPVAPPVPPGRHHSPKSTICNQMVLLLGFLHVLLSWRVCDTVSHWV